LENQLYETNSNYFSAVLVRRREILIVSVNGIRSDELHLKIKNYITKNNLEKNVVFINEELAGTCPIYIALDIFIGLICTDGSALSVKEAMWFETPVICSDCVPRPEEVILFRDRSSDELFKKIMHIYKHNNRAKNLKDKIKKVPNKKFKYNYLIKFIN
jgi:glycosyltransferase involved in cell wall biosynthesis